MRRTALLRSNFQMDLEKRFELADFIESKFKITKKCDDGKKPVYATNQSRASK